MSRATKEDWLEGPGDLEESTVQDVPVKGKSVRVRAISAGFSSQAQTEATETRTDGQQAFVTVNKAKLEALQLLHGMVDPKLDTVEEAEKVMQRWGAAIVKVIEEIDRISAIDKEAIEAARARFPGVDGESPAETLANGGDPATAGSGGSDVPVRAGAGAGKERP